MKRFLFLLAALLTIATAKAQVYDGITQPTRFRVWLSLNQPYEGGSATFNPFVGYRVDVSKWFNVTGVAQYNFHTQAFTPALWLNFDIADRFYLLSRNIYDCKAGKYPANPVGNGETASGIHGGCYVGQPFQRR